MKKILIINDTPILNFYDLKNEFLPLPLYEQFAVFVPFSQVHCCAYPTIIKADNGNKYPAKYFNKQFWQDMLRMPMQENLPKDAQACFCEMLRRSMQKAFGEDEGSTNADVSKTNNCIEAFSKNIFNASKLQSLKEEYASLPVLIKAFEGVQNECEDLKIAQKISFISRHTGEKQQSDKVILLLAISELAEQNVLDTDPGIWAEKREKSLPEQQKQAKATPIDFPGGSVLNLMCGQTYRYWQYDAKTLKSGDKIRTVRLEAKRSGAGNTATVEIYSPDSKQCIDKFMVGLDNYIYVNVAAQKVIKLLPTTVKGKDIVIQRIRDNLNVKPQGQEEWSTISRNVSCVAVHEAKNGFLVLADGKVVTLFCDDVENDYYTKLKLKAITSPVVDIKAAESGYKLLLEDGMVIETNSDKVSRNQICL